MSHLRRLRRARMANRKIPEWQYQPLASQVRFHTSLNRFKGYSGPIGSGKSHALVYEALFLSEINAGLTGLLGAPTFPMLRDSTQAAFFEIVEAEEIPYTFHKTENRVSFPENGSQILFRSLDKFERLRGTNLAWCGIDELTYCPEEAWLRLMGRLRHPQATRIEGFAAWTPRGFDPVYKRFVEDSNPNYDLTRAVPRENIYLPGDFYETLERDYDPRFFAQEVLGEYLDVFGGAVYHAYSAANEREVAYDPHLRLIWTCDFNVDPTCSLICQMAHRAASQAEIPRDAKREVRVLDEICLPDSNTEASCRDFIRRTESWTKEGRALQVEVYGDAAGSARKSAGQSDYTIIRDVFKNDPRYHLQFHIQSANPLIRDRINAVNAMLCNTLGEHRLFHHRRCQELQKDFRQVKWQRDLSGNSTGVEDKKDKRRTHVSSALGYLIDAEFSLTRKEPRIRLL